MKLALHAVRQDSDNPELDTQDKAHSNTQNTKLELDLLSRLPIG